LFSCGGGGGGEEKACPACPVCAASTPGPAPEDIRQQLQQDNIKKLAARLNLNFDQLQAVAVKLNVVDKFGRKEIAAEDFPHLVDFLWEVDPEFRVHQLRAMVAMNRLVDMLKPASGPKFDVNVLPKDPQAEDVSQLISEAIVAQTQVQRQIEEDLGALGIENVRGLRSTDDMPAAPGMMQELLSIVAPPQATPGPTPKPASAGLWDWSWLESSARAQSSRGRLATTTSTSAAPLHSTTIVRIKTKAAPLLLARVMTYDVAGKNFVLQSPFLKSIPEFQAIPAEQYQFKVEKQSVGPAYRDALDAKVQALAAKPQRDLSDWWEVSHLVAELRLANQLVDYNKIAPAAPVPVASAPPLKAESQPQPAQTLKSPTESAPSGTQKPAALESLPSAPQKPGAGLPEAPGPAKP
jgi:hypothetical protein